MTDPDDPIPVPHTASANDAKPDWRTLPDRAFVDRDQRVSPEEIERFTEEYARRLKCGRYARRVDPPPITPQTDREGVFGTGDDDDAEAEPEPIE